PPPLPPSRLRPVGPRPAGAVGAAAAALPARLGVDRLWPAPRHRRPIAWERTGADGAAGDRPGSHPEGHALRLHRAPGTLPGHRAGTQHWLFLAAGGAAEP